jgi:hypothetical protein
LYSIDGDILSNWRPNDHPWHHGLSFTLTSVDGVNFWGGPTHREKGGYQWRHDHGEQRHVGWEKQTAAEMVQRLEWRAPGRADALLMEERRTLSTTLLEDGWSLRWSSRVTNRAGKPLVCHNYHSMGGLVGSHYTGLQFRGARGLLDESMVTIPSACAARREGKRSTNCMVCRPGGWSGMPSMTAACGAPGYGSRRSTGRFRGLCANPIRWWHFLRIVSSPWFWRQGR